MTAWFHDLYFSAEQPFDLVAVDGMEVACQYLLTHLHPRILPCSGSTLRLEIRAGVTA